MVVGVVLFFLSMILHLYIYILSLYIYSLHLPFVLTEVVLYEGCQPTFSEGLDICTNPESQKMALCDVILVCEPICVVLSSQLLCVCVEKNLQPWCHWYFST